MFTTKLKYITLKKGCLWQLTAPLRFEWHDGTRHKHLIVPAGYITDFLSLPLASRILWRKDGAGKYASVLHDYAYSSLGMDWSRKDADRLFRRALKADPEHPPKIRQWLFYRAVRFGGKAWWDKRIANRKALVASLGKRAA